MSSSVFFRGMRCLHQGKPSLYLSYRPCRTERDVAEAITTHNKKPIEDRTSQTRSLQKHPTKNLHDTEQTERNGTVNTTSTTTTTTTVTTSTSCFLEHDTLPAAAS